MKKRCGDPPSWIRYNLSQPCETMDLKQSGFGGKRRPGKGVHDMADSR